MTFKKQLVLQLLNDEIKRLIERQKQCDNHDEFMDIEHYLPEVCDAYDWIEEIEERR